MKNAQLRAGTHPVVQQDAYNVARFQMEANRIFSQTHRTKTEIKRSLSLVHRHIFGN